MADDIKDMHKERALTVNESLRKELKWRKENNLHQNGKKLTKYVGNF